MSERKLRVVLSKIGLDGHDRGVLVVAAALRDAGIEVVYLGRRQMPAQIAEAAVQEDADFVGISSSADAHMTLVPEVIKELKDRKKAVPVIVGGFIQPEDVPVLKKGGVAEVFGSETNLDDIVSYIKGKAASGKRPRATKAG